MDAYIRYVWFMIYVVTRNHLVVPGSTQPQGQQLRKHIDATLGSGNLREAVRLPPGEDLNEWLAVNSEPPSPLFLLSHDC